MLNQQQKAYKAAYNALKVIEAKKSKIERDYIAAHNIINTDDGSVPECLWRIDDDAVFEKANNEVGKVLIESGLQNELNVARKTLRSAENDLINFGLSLIPESLSHEREILRNNTKTNESGRQNFIGLTMELDASTVPKFIARG